MINIKNLFQTKKFKAAVCITGIIIIALLIFQAGMFVGYKKAAFSYRWGDNYYRMFEGRKEGSREGMFMGMPRGGFSNAHGAIGKIVKIDLPIFVIVDRDNVEKIILIKDNTSIMQFRNAVKSSDLKVGDEVTVIGSPNNEAEIEARLIRLVPAMSTNVSATTTEFESK